jgi:PPOX class probable F420-dependent enzyme
MRTALGQMSAGAMAAGAAAFGAVAIGALAIRALAVKRGKIGHLSIDELEVGRLRVREPVIEEERSATRPFDVLKGHSYISLTTFRRSGEAVSTPIWFALVDDSVYATTPPDSGKMKRLRNDPRVVLTPCNAWGRPRGESVEGVARAIDGAAPERAEAALREKYWLGLALFHLLGKREIGQVTLEIHAAETNAEGA